METLRTLLQQIADTGICPPQLPAIDGKFFAILCYLTNTHIQDEDLSITDLRVTTDGFVQVAHPGDIGVDEFLGHYAALQHSLTMFCDSMQLSDADRTALFARLPKP